MLLTTYNNCNGNTIEDPWSDKGYSCDESAHKITSFKLMPDSQNKPLESQCFDQVCKLIHD